MKILRVISSLSPEGGGPIEGARKLDATLNELGVSVEVVCLDAPTEPYLKNHPGAIHAIGPSLFGYRFNTKLISWIAKNRSKYDAVIVNGIWQFHSFATWLSLHNTKTPYFVFTHGMLDPWFKRTYPLKHIKKCLYWPWAEYRVLRDAKRVIFTSEEERLLARKSFQLYHAKEAVTAYGTSNPPENGLELSKKFLAAHPHLNGKRIILFLSRIHEKKGCDLLIEAFSRIFNKDNSLRLVIAGPDQTGWASSLKAQAEKLGVSELITWPGMLQGDLKWGAFYAAETFCLPSHQENFGIVVAEALACGKPVLISNKINIWREIEADMVGFVDDDSVDGTFRNLNRWLALDKDEYSRISDRAKQSFKHRFHIRRAAERLLEIVGEK